MTLTEVSALVKGKSGTKVKVTIRRDKEEKEFEITRGKIDIQSVTTKIYEKMIKKQVILIYQLLLTIHMHNLKKQKKNQKIKKQIL